MRIAWVTRSFLDYRIPVFRELDALIKENLHLVFSGDYVPEDVADKAREVLGDRAMPMTGEWRFGPEDREFMANRNISMRFQPGLFREIEKIRPDVLVGDGFFKWTLPALAYRIRYGTPLVICYERWAHTERFAQWYRKLYRKTVLQFVDAACCNGILSKEYTIALGMAPERITTGHMTADIQTLDRHAGIITRAEKQALREKYKAAGIIYLYAGRLIPGKGLDSLMDAWALFEDVSPSGTLLIVGDGPHKNVLKSKVLRKSLTRVRFAGRIPYNDLSLYYAASDIFVMPTLEDNWSLVVPEAMACGLPVLCSKFNGCWPELVREGKNGWIFDPLDHADILRVLCAARDAAFS